MQRRTLIALAALAAAVSAPALAQSQIKIAHVYSKTGWRPMASRPRPAC